MPDANLTALDAAHMNAFIAGPVTDFKNDVVAMRGTAPASDPAGFAGVAGMFDLSSAPGAGLGLGGLASIGALHGDVVVGHTKTAETQSDAILQEHLKTFNAILANLQTVVTKLMGAEADNLATIDAQKFLDVLHDPNSAPGL